MTKMNKFFWLMGLGFNNKITHYMDGYLHRNRLIWQKIFV
jgi:hypothetical protein